ncbi:MAG TPA: hypothetical protein VFW00_06540 [Rhodocyclaceae bacterium]|nr:hypothetical protein [Rhodocyclaceae bacterium]
MRADDVIDAACGLAKWACVLFVAGFGINSCVNSEWYRGMERIEAIRARAAATPHVIREADGCKVYEFSAAGRDHYFTRCGAVVTTEKTGSESCGKNCTRPTSEIIVTKGNNP